MIGQNLITTKSLVIFSLSCLIGIICSCLSIFGNMFFFLILISISVLYLKAKKHIQDKGLVTVIPQYIAKLFIQQRLFDIICNLWFKPAINGKRLLAPLIDGKQPQQIRLHYLNEDEDTKQLIFNKRLINFFPVNIQKIIAPSILQKIEQQAIDQSEQKKYKQWSGLSLYRKKPSKTNVIKTLFNNLKLLRNFLVLDSKGNFISKKLMLKVLMVGSSILAYQIIKKPKQKIINTISTFSLVIGLLLTVSSAGVLIWQHSNKTEDQDHKQDVPKIQA